MDGGEYRFYIKDVASGEDYKKKEANKTGEYTFKGLEQNKEFKIKIEVENKNGIAQIETNVIRTVTVAELTQADLEFTYNPNDWTKDKIVVTVNAKVEIPTGYTLQTSKDMTKWENKATQEFTANGYIYVRLFDGTNGGSYAVGEVTKIDTEKPKVTTTSSTSNSITFSGTDNASGIIGYAVTTTKVEPTNFVAVDNTKALNNITIGERSQKTEYYVWLKDKAENVSEPVTIKTDEATGITQADINFTYSSSDWTNGKVTVTASLKTTIPTGYTLQTSKTATNWENKATQEFTANGYIYVRLFDGTNGGSYAVGEVTKIDTEKPKVTTTSSTSNSITFSGTDNASGIIGYKVTTSNTEPTSFDSCTSTTALNNKQVTGLTANTTYYIWLKDAAGNISEAKTEKTPVTLVTSITLNKTTLTLDKGGEETLTATVNPTNATNKGITWSTSKSSVATVSTTGKITAVAAGKATITATAKDGSGKSASCTVTVTSVPYDNPYIPTGFTHIGKEDWNSGYRISDTGDETGNIFVWVPCVLDQSKVKAGDKVQTFQKTTTGIYNSGSYGLSPTDTRVTDVEPTNAIKTSVRTYGGFYIAAYEAGIAGTTDNDSLSKKIATDGTVKPLSKLGRGVWNSITRGDALKVAASMVNTANGVKSGLISGECWDTTLQWMVNSSANATSNARYDINSTGKGWDSDVSSNTRHTTGYYGVNNIYDMAGNVWEWTTENLMYNNSWRCLVSRGGGYDYSGSEFPAAYRYGHLNDYNEDDNNGFRVVLYK